MGLIHCCEPLFEGKGYDHCPATLNIGGWGYGEQLRVLVQEWRSGEERSAAQVYLSLPEAQRLRDLLNEIVP